MKRRIFVKNIGKGISSTVIFPGLFSGRSERSELTYQYTKPDTLDQIINEDGHLALNITLSGKAGNPADRLTGKIKVKKGRINRIRSYLNLSDNEIDQENGSFDVSAFKGDDHIITMWVEEPEMETEYNINLNGGHFAFRVRDLIEKDEFEAEKESFILKANILYYQEVGHLAGEPLPFSYSEEDLRFVIMADPQGGDPEDRTNDSTTRVKIHNAFIEESIERVNDLSPCVHFTLILGDFTDSKGQESNFKKMIGFYDKLQSPILLEIGNHETIYNAKFSPGYNMDAFNNYFAAQKKVSSMDKLLYSFNAGKWHFVVWPDPLRSKFWETHPHYFDWLERDLAKYREHSVIFFQHVPIHPIGINPLVSYLNPVHINRLLFSILSRWGNVKYVFSGHVHIPIKASLKTAVSYKNIKFINLPPTGYRPRAFGEQDLYGGPSQGICIVDIKGENIVIRFHTVTNEIYEYPGEYKDYSAYEDPLWFNYKWEMPANSGVINGGFEEGLKGWEKLYIYAEDEKPSNLREVRPAPDSNGLALYLYSRKRDYDIPGQDRLPQTINQVSQIVQAEKGLTPSIGFRYRIDEVHYHPGTWNGAFLWVEGYEGPHLALSHLYAIGKAHGSVGGSYGRGVHTTFFDLPVQSGCWQDVIIQLETDYRKGNNGQTLISLGIDKYVLNFGTWTINDGYLQEIGIYFDDVFLDQKSPDRQGSSLLDGRNIKFKSRDDIFNHKIFHIAGEHQYANQKELFPW